MRAFSHSGHGLVDQIDRDAHILDVGCGQNLFKKYFPNLVGIDPADPKADLQVTIQDYQPDRKFDVALCLGSIHGTPESIRQQIIKIRDLLVPQGHIHWRTMPDPPPRPVPDWAGLWTFDRHRNLANELGFEISKLAWDLSPSGNRIYAKWVKNHT